MKNPASLKRDGLQKGEMLQKEKGGKTKEQGQKRPVEERRGR